MTLTEQGNAVEEEENIVTRLVDGAYDGAPFLREGLQSLHQLVCRSSVEPRRGLVAEQDAWVAEHLYADTDAPTFPSGAALV